MNIASMVMDELENIGKQGKTKGKKCKLPEFTKPRRYKARRVAQKRVFAD